MGILIHGRLLYNIGTELIIHILNGQMKDWNRTNYTYPKWTDERFSDNEFVINMGEYKYYINNGIFTYWERLYNLPEMIMGYNNNKKNKILKLVLWT